MAIEQGAMRIAGRRNLTHGTEWVLLDQTVDQIIVRMVLRTRSYGQGDGTAYTASHGTESGGVHLTLRAGREKGAIPLPSVQQAQPYLAVLSTFSTAGAAKPLPSSTFSLCCERQSMPPTI